jgi:hypothetical protein
MAIVGFSFSKFKGERLASKASGNIEVNHNISIKDVKKIPFKVAGNTTDILKIQFGFDVKYGDNLGEISIEGEVLYSDNKEIIEESVKGFEKDKKLNPIVNNQIINFIYSKTIIKTLEMADNLSLPAPIPMPKVQVKSE